MGSERNNAGKTYTGPDGKFRTGNPGRPKGARHKATLAAEALLDGQAEALTQAAIEAALEGDVQAMRLCLDRLLPARKGRPVTFDVGPTETAADLAAAARRLLEAVATGTMTPEEAQAVGAVIEQARRSLEVEDLARRLEAIEQRTGARR